MAETLEHWATRLPKELREWFRALPARLAGEADALARAESRAAPRRSGALAASFRGVGPRVETTSPYAIVQDEGGVIRAKHGMLVVPVRPGYRPGQSGFVTVDGQVFRRGSPVLYAVRKREVRIRASRYLRKGLEEHLRTADERVAATLPDVR